MRNTNTLKERLEEAGYDSQLNEALYQYLYDLGYTQQLDDNLYNYLEDQGYEGQITEKLKQWDEDLFNLFTPVFLFSNGEQGAFYNFSETNTVFEDVGGNNPSEHTQPIARVNDLSGNNLHATI